MLIAYIWGLDSETDVYSDWFLILTKILQIWFLGFTTICCQFTAYYLVPMSYCGIFAGLCSKLSSDSLLKKTGYRASEAYPLKDFAGERLGTLCRKLLRLLTKEVKVPCTGNHPCIILRKIDESCLGSFSGILRGRLGCLHQKLLIVICGPISTYITIWIFLLLISCMKRGFAGLSSFLSTCHIFACFQVHQVPKSSSAKN